MHQLMSSLEFCDVFFRNQGFFEHIDRFLPQCCLLPAIYLCSTEILLQLSFVFHYNPISRKHKKLAGAQAGLYTVRVSTNSEYIVLAFARGFVRAGISGNPLLLLPYTPQGTPYFRFLRPAVRCLSVTELFFILGLFFPLSPPVNQRNQLPQYHLHLTHKTTRI